MIRKLKKSDFKEYLNLMRGFRKIEEVTKQVFFERYDLIFKSSEIWVVIDDDKICGSITIFFDYKFINNFGVVGHIEDVFVHKDHRKKGYGSLLINKAIQLCKDKSCYKVSLNCNESSKNFYRKNGFIENEYQMVYFICNDLKK